MIRRRVPGLTVAAVALAGALAVLAACAGGGATSATTSTLPTLPPSFASTAAPPPPPSTTPDGSTLPSTTTTVAGPAWPLTGTPGASTPRAQLPALVVKIDNHPLARPQTGLVQADVVYEEIVEGITRFFAVFHSATSDPVGPIRSARTTDIALLAQLNHPLFAWSGGNKGTVNALKQANVATDLGASTGRNYRAGGYFRDPSRRSPHNLYSTTTSLWGLTPEGAAPPLPLFTYRPPGAAPAGVTPVVGAKLTMAATRVQWQWDAAAGAWQRLQDNTPHVDANGAVIAPQNVVVMFVPYRKSAADPISPEAVTIGQGEAWVLTGGGAVKGTWTRPDPSKPAVLRDGAGQEIALTPGRTWVELARAGGAALIPEGTSPAAVPYPS